MTSPVVSVVMATYNHAPYVAQAIESVLMQSDVDFEFLIADDGSADTTVRVVESIRDPRIRFYPHRTNRGACIVINELIGLASGEFVAVINSDDFWIDRGKLAFQLDIMRRNPELAACFGRVRFVDKKGCPIKKSALLFGEVFDQQNRSPGEWLRYFFEFGNCICHPTVLIRRRCYEELGGYNNNFRQLPDFDMWIRLLKKYPIHISEREMLNFRILPGENASSLTVANSVRTMNEHYLIAESFFDDFDARLLKEGFSDLLKSPEIPTSVHFDIERVLLLFAPCALPGKAYKIIGMTKLNHLLSSNTHRKVLEDVYKIDARWFQGLMAEIDILRPRAIALLGQKKKFLTIFLKRLISFFMRRG